MDKRIIFFAILLSILVTSLQEEVASNTDYDYDDDYYDDDPEPESDSEELEDTTPAQTKGQKEVQIVNIKGSKISEVKRDREELTTVRPLSKYEVTELVIDVPDVNNNRIPIITNFTVTKPLNFAGVPNNKTNNVGVNVKDEGDEIINSIFVPDKPKVKTNNEDKNVKDLDDILDENKDETNYFSNFSPKDDFHDEFDKDFDSDEDDFDVFETKDEPKPKKSFKDFFHNFGKTIENKFKSVVDKHSDSFHDSLRKFVHGPVSFLNKLHKKSSDLANKLHNAVSRHKLNNKDDAVNYHDINHSYEYDYK